MNRTRVLFVNPAEKACGVWQFGKNLFDVISKSERVDFMWYEPTSEAEFFATVDFVEPELIFINFYPSVFPWLTLDTLIGVRNRGLKIITIFHEVPVTGFDALVYPDPTFEPKSRLLNDWFRIGRPLPVIMPPPDEAPDLDNPIIGTSGFGFNNKGYPRLVQKVMEEWDTATIRMHLPYARYGDITGARARMVAAECRELVKQKPGITLEIDHKFLSRDEYIGWLAANDLNAYLYDEMPGRGIASTIDFALMANRPIAVSKTTMFRHMALANPSVYVEDSSLREILERGVDALEPLHFRFRDEKMIHNIEEIVVSVLYDRRKICHILNDDWRDAMEDVIIEMRRTLPDMMGRKIPEANVQQAWIVQMVRNTEPQQTLCVGCFEDTAYELLKNELYVVGTDPLVNSMDLHQFRHLVGGEFECVFACSVIEHVENDEQFIDDMCALLKTDGVGLLTCDFREDWKPGMPLPATDVRLYTSADIERLGRVLRRNNCYWIDKPDTSGAPDFHYQGHDYSFMALAFKKL